MTERSLTGFNSGRFIRNFQPLRPRTRAALQERLSEQRLCRVAGARLYPAESRLERRSAPQCLAFCSRDVPGRKGLAVGPIANDASDARDLQTPYVRLNLFNAVVHNVLPQKTSLKSPHATQPLLILHG